MMTRALLFLCLLLASSCAHRNLTYLSDLEDEATHTESITNEVDPKIQSNDLLEITITSLSPESNILFNRGIINTGGAAAAGGNNGGTTAMSEGYLVDKDGYITFPVLGRIKLAGLTKREATEALTAMLSSYARDPIVYLKFQNFKVTVIGEVKRPASFTVPSEKINIFEALGLAGDMTEYGKRENVLLMREQNGQRITTRVNLNSKDVLNSPYFYLQQNDIIYVEPDVVKAVQVSGGRRNFQFGVAIMSAVFSVTTFLLTRIL
ncbi:polysaccharide biosynthesis/export family protein [uncultured Pontibacter sp.]|uniref:polysaccharide biosynthesis/export family protein n=1 Tax=uncultured Pontibacter sp. TaxID=453356 RepID=UPI002628C711|nr:polysaccharide biosynthesis/export family protein [uncultured Pontibacter sp.]